MLFTALALIGALLTACKPVADVSPSPSLSPSTTMSPSPSPTPTPTPSPSPSPSPSTLPSPDDGVMARGTWDGNVYTNEDVALRFELPDGWTYYSDEQLADLMGVDNDLLADEDRWLLEAAQLTTVYDMMAINETTGANVVVVYENLKMTPGGTDATIDQYIEAVKMQMEQIASFDYEFVSTISADIAGNSYKGISMAEKSYGFTSDSYYRLQDDYLIGVTVTAMGDTSAADILAYFN